MGRAGAIPLGAALIFLSSCLGPQTALAASSGGAHDSVEKTIPQGKDPLGSDDDQRTAHPAEHKGVLPPPPVGDEGLYTKVPNPDGVKVRTKNTKPKKIPVIDGSHHGVACDISVRPLLLIMV
jgi:hypothetical protein